jgi:hypothetical protein
MWSCIQLNKSAHVYFQHISISIGAGASAPKQSTKTKAFQLDMSETVILVSVPIKKKEFDPGHGPTLPISIFN